MKQLVDKFNSEHPNIKVTMNTQQWADYYAKLPSAVTAGKGPEVAIMHVDSVATNAARRVIQPLDDVAKALNLSEADFATVPWSAGIYNDQRYAIPLDVHPLGFFYNKAVMEKAGLDPEKPPTTADEYMSALDTLKSKDIEGHWATPFPFTGSMTVQSLLWQFGGNLFSEDASTATWADEAGVKAMTWFTDLVKNGHSPGKIAQDADIVAFQNDKTAFNWNGIWTINTLKEKESLEWGVARAAEHRRAGRGLGRLPPVRAADAEDPGREQEHRRSGVRQLDQPAVAGVGQGRAGAGPQHGPRVGGVQGAHRPGRARRPDRRPALRATRARHRRRHGGVGQGTERAVLGTKTPQAALSDAAGRANKILEANKKKYGVSRHGHRDGGPGRPAGPRRRKRAGKESRFGGVHGSRATPYLFLLPYLVLFLTFVVVPAVFGIWISLHNWDFLLPGKPFVGLENYTALFDPSSVQFEPFWHGMRATAIFTVASVPFLVVIPLGLAVLLNRAFPGRTFFRAVFFAPYVLGVAVIGLMWRYLLDPSFGAVNGLLAVFGIPPVNWITEQPWAWISLVGVTVWWTIGFNAIIYLAGLADISSRAVRGRRPRRRLQSGSSSATSPCPACDR